MGISRGIRTRAPTSFSSLDGRKEAKEDQDDDRPQVGRMGAGSCFSLHWVRPVGIGDTEYIHGANLKDDGHSFCGSFAL